MPNDLKPQGMPLSRAGRDSVNFIKHQSSGFATATIWTLSGIVLAACSGGGQIGKFFGLDDDDDKNPTRSLTTADPDAVKLTTGELALSPTALTHSAPLAYQIDPDTVLMVEGPAAPVNPEDDVVPEMVTLPANINEPLLVFLQRGVGTSATVETGTRAQFETARTASETDPRAFIIGVLVPGDTEPAWHPVTTDMQLYNAPPVLTSTGTTATIVEDASTSTATGTLTTVDVNDHEEPPAYSATQARYGTIAINGSTWTYTLDNTNAAVNALGAVTDTLTDTIIITVRDGGGATDSVQITITITGVNDAPEITAAVSSEQLVNQADTTDNDYTPFSGTADATRIAGLLNYADAEGDAITAMRLTGTLPAGMNVAIAAATPGGSDTDVSADDTINLADIPRLTFTVANPATSREGTFAYMFQVTDDTSIDGNTVWSDAGAFTLNIVTEPNVAPTIRGGRITETEDEVIDNRYTPFDDIAGATLAATQFGFRDSNTGDEITAIRFTSTTAPGVTIIAGGSPVTIGANGTAITVAQLAGLTFTTFDTDGVAHYDFTYEVRDSNDTWSTGADGNFRLTINGTPEPVIGGDLIGEVDETEDIVDDDADDMGVLTAAGIRPDETAAWGFAPGRGVTEDAAFGATAVGRYGTLTFNAETLTWTYELEEEIEHTDALKPLGDGDVSGSMTAEANSDAYALDAGTIEYNPDLDQIEIVDASTVIAGGRTLTVDDLIIESSLFGTGLQYVYLAYIEADDLTDPRIGSLADIAEDTIAIIATFDPDTGALHRVTTDGFLPGDTFPEEVFTVRLSDGTNIGTENIVITVNGAGEGTEPEIGGDLVGEVDETPDTMLDDADVMGVLTASGIDPANEVATWLFAPGRDVTDESLFETGAVGRYGTLTFNEETLTWTYQLERIGEHTTTLNELNMGDVSGRTLTNVANADAFELDVGTLVYDPVANEVEIRGTRTYDPIADEFETMDAMVTVGSTDITVDNTDLDVSSHTETVYITLERDGDVQYASKRLSFEEIENSKAAGITVGIIAAFDPVTGTLHRVTTDGTLPFSIPHSEEVFTAMLDDGSEDDPDMVNIVITVNGADEPVTLVVRAGQVDLNRELDASADNTDSATDDRTFTLVSGGEVTIASDGTTVTVEDGTFNDGTSDIMFDGATSNNFIASSGQTLLVAISPTDVPGGGQVWDIQIAAEGSIASGAYILGEVVPHTTRSMASWTPNAVAGITPDTLTLQDTHDSLAYGGIFYRAEDGTDDFSGFEMRFVRVGSGINPQVLVSPSPGGTNTPHFAWVYNSTGSSALDFRDSQQTLVDIVNDDTTVGAELNAILFDERVGQTWHDAVEQDIDAGGATGSSAGLSHLTEGTAATATESATGDYYWAGGGPPTSTLNWDADGGFEQFVLRNAFSQYEFDSGEGLFRLVHGTQFHTATPELTLGMLVSEGNDDATFTLKSGGGSAITLESDGTLKKVADQILTADATLVVTVDPDGDTGGAAVFDETFVLDIA